MGGTAMAFRITPAVFAREAKRRLMDIRDMQEHTGLKTRQGVWLRVRAGTLPEPVVSVDRSYALWDRDELETPGTRSGGK